MQWLNPLPWLRSAAWRLAFWLAGIRAPSTEFDVDDEFLQPE